MNRLDSPEKPRVLFVDDEDFIRRIFARLLADAEIEITVAQSAEEALDAVRARSYAVVIADYQMPGMNGVRFLKEVRQLDPHSVRILLSGRADFDVAVDAINSANLFGFICKPWDPNELRNTVRKSVEHYSINMENRRLSSELGFKCSELEQLTHSLEKEVQGRTTSLLLGLVNALDLRDTETQWHSRRVALYSKRLAQQLGLSGDDMLSVERGALLHDIGKIGVSDTILLKPGKLTAQEWDEMKRHSEYGYRIVQGIDFLGDARLLVWQHHERWDGNGYPNGLTKSDSYIGARIFAVIDTYDAITSDRPYRKAQPHEVATEEIEKMTGTQFDPKIVAAWNAISLDEIQELRDRAADPKAGLD